MLNKTLPFPAAKRLAVLLHNGFTSRIPLARGLGPFIS